MSDDTPPADTPPNLPWAVRRIDDPKELRALAHPVRFALIDLLAEGPMTASQCATRLAETPANCSYHLRQLASYGHVFPAEGGRGRERYWKSREEAISIADDGPGGHAAARAVGEAVDAYRFAQWSEFADRRDAEPADWRTASLSTDVVSWLTAEELRVLTGNLHALFAPYAQRDHDPSSRPGGSRAVRFFAYAYPGGPSPADEADS